MQGPFDIAADLDTPVSAYLKLKPFRPRFLLESVEGGQVGRYSFLGFGNGDDIVLESDRLTVNGRSQPAPRTADELMTALRNLLARTPAPVPQLPGIPLTGGLVGVAGYDLVRYFERLPAHRGELQGVPLAAFTAPPSVLVFDHVSRRVALLHAGSEQERVALRKEIMVALRGPIPDSGHRRVTLEEARPSATRKKFIQAVGNAKDNIAAGDIFQIVLSVRFSGRTNIDPFETYRALRLLNPSPYMFFCDLQGVQVVGSSPEALVQLNGGAASLRPIAGTRPRGSNHDEDLRLEQELLADPKENAEHVMLVDLARNDLGRVARAGSVQVEPYRSIERYSHVMHIVSGVRGTLAEGRDAFDLFRAAFPAGTLVGAPKVRAMELIADLEPCPRGLYAGTVGYFDRCGNMDQAIAIRTLVFSGDEYSFQAGAGVVADSVPELEYEEVLAKSAILRRALEIARDGL